ncbi:DUF4468 domain-containing protein [Lutibacter aestuarii]|uniref:DUF4468 domain-containing protein n=1 Tax=Lutibacter aestuarii TaxID=861111 RepID=A0ABW2Z857_9FLAO
MKRLLFIFITSFTIINCGSLVATKVPAEEFSQEKIIENLNLKKDKLYVISNDWMVDTFNDAESVIQFTDKEEGIVIGKYLLQGELIIADIITNDTRIFAKIKIEVKDNKAKINITPTTAINIFKEQHKLTIKDKINNLIISFENKISSINSNSW